MKVESTFMLEKVGLVVVGPYGIMSRFHNGDEVTIIKPDGKEHTCKAYLVHSSPNPKNLFSLSLPGLTKEDVPIGSDIVWGWF